VKGPSGGPGAHGESGPAFTDAERRVVLDYGEIVRGRDGWLFLDSDSNTLRQHTGEVRLSDDALSEWRTLLESRMAWLEQLGISYVFAVAPDPHAVYPEKLPVPVASDRPVVQLRRHLAEEQTFARLVYPIDEMLREKVRRPVYSETDSHWNFLGAFVAYRAIIAEVARHGLDARLLREPEVGFGVAVFPGALGIKVEPKQSSPQVIVRWMPKAARLLHDNCVLNHGSLMELKCEEAPETTCLLLGDSYAVNPLLYLAESFGRVVYAHTSQLDFDLVRELKPDVVVSLTGERFIPDVPYDLPSKSVHEMARQKREAGETRGRLAWWG
jgi:alginate O-acetyltransferase complex protein AlgJ